MVTRGEFAVAAPELRSRGRWSGQHGEGMWMAERPAAAGVPALAGKEWCFENAVGVDCSSPEPRCIWLAVLRGVRVGSPPGPPGRGAHRRERQHCWQPRAKGRRDGISSSNENARPASGEGLAWQGPRTVVLHKNSQGFGFTLRHFIVYPPESALHTSLKDEENGNGKGCQRGRLEPMDTIFVKNVRERGPAHQAGLCTGDRLVKVNGESVLGKTYSQVIALIQNSESVLELSIMPKDEDVLQLAYSQDAYLKGNEPYTGGAQNLPDPPPISYPRSKAQQPPAAPVPTGQNQLDNRSCWPGSSVPPSPLDNRSGDGSAAGWQEGRGVDPRAGGSGASPAHRSGEVKYAAGAGGRAHSASSGGALVSPLHFHFANHNAAIVSASQPQPHSGGLSKSERCQQALTDWYYSQVPERTGGAMPPRHRSYSQDRLAEVGAALGHHRGGWPHSASQDTLLLQHGSAPQGDPYWAGGWGTPYGQASNRARSENLLATAYDRCGRSNETLDQAAALVSPRFERPAWLLQAQQAPPRTEGQQRPGNHCGGTSAPSAGRQAQAQQQQAASHSQSAAQPRRLPTQAMDEQPVGYRSYSPSFYRKAGRLMQAHSFRDPTYSGPHFSWTPTPKTSPPDSVSAATSIPCSSSPPATTPEPQNGACRQSSHERVGEEREAVAQTQEVVLRQKPPTGRRTSHALRHPHYALPIDAAEPPGFPAESHDSAPGPTPAPAPAPAAPRQGGASRRANGSLPPLPVEDDSLASIPFIDEPTSPSADLRARHVPASSVVSSAMSSAPAVTTSPASPTFTFPLTRLFSHDCSSIKASRRSSYLLAITTERSKSCDEGLNTFREEGRVFSRLPKRVKSFFTDGSLDSLGSAEDTRSKRHSTSELGNLSFSDVRREGWLHYKQILTEKGKKVGGGIRPWKRVFSVLRSHSLFLYKDKREAVMHSAAVAGGGAGGGAGHGEDEQPISIRGCLVDIAYSETKRKHALRLTTQDFCEYLLQAEDRDDMLGWIKVIRENSKTDSEDLGFSRQALINKKLNDYRKHSPTGSKPDSSPRVPRMKPPFLLAKTDNTAGAPRSPKPDGKDESSPPKSPWGINIMKKSKKSGPKAFGVRLEDCQPSVSNKFIPLIVEICCGLVEDMGLEYTGIYRVPGNNAVVSSLQDQLNKGVDINPTEEKWQDLNVISSLLKSFFRKLPEPLFTDDKYNDFIDANRMEDARDRLKTMKKLIHDLPDHYYHTLKFLVGHLKTVADHADKNKMEPRNLALVFGPTLVRTSEDNMTDMVTHMPDRYKIVETLIQHHAWFFNEGLDKDEKTPVETGDLQPVPNIDHLLSNIGRTALLGEASDSTNSDSAKSKDSWGSKRDLNAKDFLSLSIISAVTRKRKKRPNARLLGSSTDEDSEHEPIKASNRGGRGPERGKLEGAVGTGGGDTAPRAEGEEDDEEEEEEEEDGRATVEVEGQPHSRLCEEEIEEGVTVGMLAGEGGVGVKVRAWRGPEDARSIVSGYSTLSTLGRSLASEGRGDEADDEHSELVSETDNESGFASRSLTQERPEKPAQPPRSFLYSHCKAPAPPGASPTRRSPLPTVDAGDRGEGRARSTTPSSSSFSSSSAPHRLHSRPSFNSHKLIQCDTLARKKLKGEKAKARSLDLQLELGPSSEDGGVDTAPAGEGPRTGQPGSQGGRAGAPRAKASSSSSQDSLHPAPASAPLPSPPPPGENEAASFSPGGDGRGSLVEQVRARLMTSADDMRAVGLRKPVSPETRRKKSTWRRHTVVVSLGGLSDAVAAPADVMPGCASPPAEPLTAKSRGAPLNSELASPPARHIPASTFHQCL
ncbi:rho GTPase-activating protein 23-like [Megalops cyprinoides]|uniref:rho GTPase-activating protein 23-like n=1 Tax=Megalops cyprinoides TaxID=118141 RepID=UPI001863F831|nr:rho GTPase-activating protein 23-like [Megalops cyprinoides]